MENPCKILLFGDSITKGYSSLFEKQLRSEYPEIDLSVENEGVSGETSSDGVTRLPLLLEKKPDVVVIGFGMNDWRKGVSRTQYKTNLALMIDEFEKIQVRVILTTISPSYNFKTRTYHDEVDNYSNSVRELAKEKKLKIADINALWKQRINKPYKGLKDELHPNFKGYSVICESLMWIVPRKYTTILWQYNGFEAKCNYRCPYCYYIGIHSPKDLFFGTIDQWHKSFKNNFGNQHLSIYLAHGEPTCGDNFLEILDMIGSEPNWEMRMTTNLSYNLEKIVISKCAVEKRLNINASFHPCMTSRDEFLTRLKYLRDHGMEVPVVYVAYPPYLLHFEDDIQFFRDEGFLVHVRRFQGRYNNQEYPYAYTEKEIEIIAKYSDIGTIKYQLYQKNFHHSLTYAGYHFFIVDNVGNAGYDSNIFTYYTKY